MKKLLCVVIISLLGSQACAAPRSMVVNDPMPWKQLHEKCSVEGSNVVCPRGVFLNSMEQVVDLYGNLQDLKVVCEYDKRDKDLSLRQCKLEKDHYKAELRKSKIYSILAIVGTAIAGVLAGKFL